MALPYKSPSALQGRSDPPPAQPRHGLPHGHPLSAEPPAAMHHAQWTARATLALLMPTTFSAMHVRVKPLSSLVTFTSVRLMACTLVQFRFV